MLTRRKATASFALLVGVCLLAASFPLAANAEESSPADSSYTVTIPTELVVGDDGSGSMDVTAKLAEHHKLNITAASNGKLSLAGGLDPIAYSLAMGNSTDGTISFDNLSGSQSVDFSTKVTANMTEGSSAAYSGVHSDTATFTISCETASYTLSFDVNGGNALSSDEGNRQVEYGAAYGELPKPSRTGYTFAGWYTLAEGGDSVSDSTTMGGSDATVYAHWEANTYRVSFDPNASWLGQGSMNPQDMDYGTSYALNANQFTNSYTDSTKVRFAGWNTERNGSGTSYSDGATVSNLTAENGETVTLYAQWEFCHALVVSYDASVEDNTKNYVEYDACKWSVPGKTVTWSEDDLLNLVDTDVECSVSNWKKEWGDSVAFPVVTTGVAATSNTLTLDRQIYKLDLNGRLDNGTITGNLKDSTSKVNMGLANVYVNEKLEGSGVYDYWREHKYGAEYRVELVEGSVADGYEYVNTVNATGKVHGETKQSTEDEASGHRWITAVTMCFKTKTSDDSANASSDAEDLTAQMVDGGDKVLLPSVGDAGKGNAVQQTVIGASSDVSDLSSKSASESSSKDDAPIAAQSLSATKEEQSLAAVRPDAETQQG